MSYGIASSKVLKRMSEEEGMQLQPDPDPVVLTVAAYYKELRTPLPPILSALKDAITANTPITFLVQTPHVSLPSTLKFLAMVYGLLPALQAPRLDMKVRFATTAYEETAVWETPCDYGESVVVARRDEPPPPRFSVTALGGTFDRLHAGHRLLLTAATLVTEKTLRVGLTGDSLLEGKAMGRMIETWKDRRRAVERFVKRATKNKVKPACVELKDPSGPAATEANIQGLVVSTETINGGRVVNEERVRNGLAPLHIVVVDLVTGSGATPGDKLSSTQLRMRDSQNGPD
eukprot:Plantae.Rhodophyta-Rhodochaete_pulchella.ctg6000.p1 GENE.Plantae.Rhodophyta-Rhodochaete_pulchella.ctg6000~~Plantae.Rhodophyta-Rhodochaete_pulchella.ctg6000.p1  ORF type:complete len:289 (+),score=29.56 Plantae.Rhodophyta-Rhodochaete_pulchella.ctg6000:922-1788(+)